MPRTNARPVAALGDTVFIRLHEAGPGANRIPDPPSLCRRSLDSAGQRVAAQPRMSSAVSSLCAERADSTLVQPMGQTPDPQSSPILQGSRRARDSRRSYSSSLAACWAARSSFPAATG
jgi:hypothetical protein